MMKELGTRLRSRGIHFDGVDQRIMCFAHVINICCQHVIKEFTNIELSESTDEFIAAELSYLPQHQTFEDAVKRDPVAMGRSIVRVLQSSGQRRKAFNDTIVDGNKSGAFPSEIRELQLLRDVRTRWDSVYSMISRLRILQPVRYLLSYLTKVLLI